MIVVSIESSSVVGKRYTVVLLGNVVDEVDAVDILVGFVNAVVVVVVGLAFVVVDDATVVRLVVVIIAGFVGSE